MHSKSSVSGKEDTLASSQRLLILHCDDLGLAHCVNEAAFHAFETGCITSASVMPVCPYFSEIVDYVKDHPGLDLGVHLTLTSEWSHYRWKPVAALHTVPSLVGADGYMWPDAASVLKHARPAEIAVELQAQIQKVIDENIMPTHLDSHMWVLLASRTLFSIYANAGRTFFLPIAVPFRFGTNLSAIHRNKQAIPLDCYFAATTSWRPEQWLDHYVDCVEHLVPGVNQITVHLARQGSEMAAIQTGHEAQGWNGDWRQRDLDAICSTRFRNTLAAANVKLAMWRDLSHHGEG